MLIYLPHSTVSSLWIETFYKYPDIHLYPNSQAQQLVHGRHLNLYEGELKWICLKVMGGHADSLVMISVQQFSYTQLINANPLSKITVSAKLCVASKCFWTVIVTAGFRNGTQSTFERVHLSQELLPLKWPWKNQFGFLSEISWSLLTEVGVLGMDSSSSTVLSISKSIPSPLIWFPLSVSCHQKSSPMVQRAQFTHTFDIYWVPLTHSALCSGQGHRNGQNTAIVLKKVHSLIEGRQRSQYCGMSHCGATWQAALRTGGGI